MARLMYLAAKSWQLREAARTAIAAGAFRRGSELAAQAQDTQGTPAGEALRRMGEWLEARYTEPVDTLEPPASTSGDSGHAYLPRPLPEGGGG